MTVEFHRRIDRENSYFPEAIFKTLNIGPLSAKIGSPNACNSVMIERAYLLATKSMDINLMRRQNDRRITLLKFYVVSRASIHVPPIVSIVLNAVKFARITTTINYAKLRWCKVVMRLTVAYVRAFSFRFTSTQCSCFAKCPVAATK